MSPASQALIIDALAAAGLPDGVVNYLTCAPAGCARAGGDAYRPSGGAPR
jgi:acyl-CoA reductase-like NAD-dependent aldehyde dehydrogenase